MHTLKTSYFTITDDTEAKTIVIEIADVDERYTFNADFTGNVVIERDGKITTTPARILMALLLGSQLWGTGVSLASVLRTAIYREQLPTSE